MQKAALIVFVVGLLITLASLLEPRRPGDKAMSELGFTITLIGSVLVCVFLP